MSPSSQLLILGVPGLELTPEDADIYRRLQPGGFILATRNIASHEQVRRLTDDLRDLCEIEPFLCMGNEGGRVWPTSVPGHSPPSAGQMRIKDTPALIARHGWITGRLLRLLGLNFNLAPVLDIDGSPDAPNARRGRCWGQDDQEVINHAGVFNRYQRRQGILGCGKHFPAGGRDTADLTIDDLLRSDLLPYTALMPELDGIMLSHTHFPNIDAGLPAALSHRIITRLLRDQIGYERLVLTDDLEKGAIQQTFGAPQAARLAAGAGADLLLLGPDPTTAARTLAALDELPPPVLTDALDRIEFAKKRLHQPTGFTPEALDGLNDEIRQLRVDTLGEEAASQP